MGTRVIGLLAGRAVLFARRAAADETATGVVTIALTDGASLVETIVAEDEIAVTLRNSSGMS